MNFAHLHLSESNKGINCSYFRENIGRGTSPSQNNSSDYPKRLLFIGTGITFYLQFHIIEGHL
jgi:hypothetical protein